MDEVERTRKEFRYEIYEHNPAKALEKASKWVADKRITRIVDIQFNYGNFGYVLLVSWVIDVV